MNKLAVIITTPPYSNLTVTALDYIETALDAGIDVVGVFFYQAGALHANENISIASDEYQSINHLKRLHHKYKLSLYVCISAAEKRGVIAETLSEKELVTTNEIFTVSGLGELVTLNNNSVRMVQF